MAVSLKVLKVKKIKRFIKQQKKTQDPQLGSSPTFEGNRVIVFSTRIFINPRLHLYDWLVLSNFLRYDWALVSARNQSGLWANPNKVGGFWWIWVWKKNTASSGRNLTI